MTTDQRYIQSAEAQRDLRSQMGALAIDDDHEVQAYEWSPGRKYVKLWSRTTGEEVTLPRYQAVSALNTPDGLGGYAWTTHSHECDCGKCQENQRAPKAVIGSTKCFLHAESPEREILNRIGITQTCQHATLSDEYSKWQHAKRHPSLLARYNAEIERIEKAASLDRTERQMEAMMSLARGNAKGKE